MLHTQAPPEAGIVHTINRGSTELRRLLAAAGTKLVVVDWFAPWCRPCQMIKPLFENLASKHMDVVFVQVSFLQHFDTSTAPSICRQCTCTRRCTSTRARIACTHSRVCTQPLMDVDKSFLLTQLVTAIGD